MSNFVQVRFATTGSAVSQVNHDFRLTKPNYLRDSMFHNSWNNHYFGYDPKQVKTRVKESYKEYNQIFRENHKKKYGKYRNLTKGKQSDFLSGVVTLSPSINEKLKSGKVTKDELEQAFNNSMKMIQNKINTILDEEIELFSVVLHYDEKTPHIHFAFANHTKQGESVHMKLKSYGRTYFQDLVGEAFKDLGYVRGNKKSTARNLKVGEMHQVEIKNYIAQIKGLIKKLQEKKKDLKELISLKQNKVKLKEQLDQIDLVIRNSRILIKENINRESLEKQIPVLEEKIFDIEQLENKLTVFQTLKTSTISTVKSKNTEEKNRGINISKQEILDHLKPKNRIENTVQELIKKNSSTYKE